MSEYIYRVTETVHMHRDGTITREESLDRGQEIVRCKECVLSLKSPPARRECRHGNLYWAMVDDNHFCGYGRRGEKYVPDASHAKRGRGFDCESGVVCGSYEFIDRYGYGLIDQP